MLVKWKSALIALVLLQPVPACLADSDTERWLVEAEAGSTDAQVNLWLAYSVGEGYGVKQDPVKALYWLRTAAEQGDRTASIAYAGKLYRGEDVVQDRALALSYWQRLAEHDVSDALYELGLAYAGERDYGLTPDPQRATDYLRRSAEKGRIDAQLAYAKRLADGVGVEQNKAAAIEWYRKAAAKGNREAKVRLLGLGA
ncbi:MAG: tetratricopeptide repeat protein [Pseudomonas sp.]